VTDFDEQTWDGAMRRAHAAIVASERLYEETTAPEGARASTSTSACGGRR
jgi:hypothetical protein